MAPKNRVSGFAALLCMQAKTEIVGISDEIVL
jgi:hypothetical protein